MNSCILLAQIQDAPKLRKTQEGQTLTEMLVLFAGSRSEDPPSPLRVVAWGNLAEEAYEHYFAGDRVIIVGRLKMMTVERDDTSGQRLKEKRAELVASSFEKITGATESPMAVSSSEARPSNVIPMDSYNKPPAPETPAPSRSRATAEPAAVATPKASAPVDEADLDDIPF